jgi:hypothetical protein
MKKSSSKQRAHHSACRARDLAQVVQRALARHAAARVHATAQLVDVDVVGVELQVLFLAFEHVVAFDRLHAQLHARGRT